MKSDAASAFERLTRDFLATHVSVEHEWCPIHDRFFGDRLEIVFPPASSAGQEVWASMSEVQIAVGAGDEHTDFESFGRRMSDAEVAHEAFSHLTSLLRQHGQVVD